MSTSLYRRFSFRWASRASTSLPVWLGTTLGRLGPEACTPRVEGARELHTKHIKLNASHHSS